MIGFPSDSRSLARGPRERPRKVFVKVLVALVVLVVLVVFKRAS